MIPVEATGNTDTCWLLLPLEFELCHTEQVERFKRVLPDAGRALKYLHFQEPGPWLLLVATIPGTPSSLGSYRCRCSSTFHFLKHRPTSLAFLSTLVGKCYIHNTNHQSKGGIQVYLNVFGFIFLAEQVF